MGIGNMTSHTASEKEVYVFVRVRSIFACAMHWVLFVAITVLIVTGFYIGYPLLLHEHGEAVDITLMADIRFIHFMAAWALFIGSLVRLYLSFTVSCNKDFLQFIPTPHNVISAIKLAWFYVTLRGPHEHYRFVNPLGGGVGIFTMCVLFAVQMVTGLAMYLEGADPSIWGWAFFVRNLSEDLMGGNQGVRVIHHVAMYALMAVIVIHVYMQIWKNSFFTEADISSIVGGYKIFPYSQIGHFSDWYGLNINEPPPSKEEMTRASTESTEIKI